MFSDGPVPSGTCSQCGDFVADDIYRYRGVILCGDCRYYIRHGRWPNYTKGFGGATAKVTEEEAISHGLRVHRGG